MYIIEIHKVLKNSPKNKKTIPSFQRGDKNSKPSFLIISF